MSRMGANWRNGKNSKKSREYKEGKYNEYKLYQRNIPDCCEGLQTVKNTPLSQKLPLSIRKKSHVLDRCTHHTTCVKN